MRGVRCGRACGLRERRLGVSGGGREEEEEEEEEEGSRDWRESNTSCCSALLALMLHTPRASGFDQSFQSFGVFSHTANSELVTPPEKENTRKTTMAQQQYRTTERQNKKEP